MNTRSISRRAQNRMALRGIAVLSGIFLILAAIGGNMAMGHGAPHRDAPGAAPHIASPAAPVPVMSVVRIGCTVSDLDRSIDFYTRVLSFEKVAEEERDGTDLEHLTGVFGARTRSARLRLGSEEIELTQFLAPEGRPIPADSRSNDRWFQHIAIVVTDMDRAYAHLRAHHIRHASSGPQTLPASIPAAAGISAFYFMDPDGHALEIIHFPAGKGDPRWQTPRDSSSLFLGIDHTAIVVADTDASLRFYQDTLGMRVAGESENFGSEQEHLNNVFGAHLRITALRAAKGPGVELLEYLAPATGRAYPADSHVNDLWHWQTTVSSSALASAQNTFTRARTPRVSHGLVNLDHSRALMVRDPDGHALLVTEP